MITTTKEFLNEITFKAYDQLAENFGKNVPPDNFEKFPSLKIFEETYKLVSKYLLEEIDDKKEHNSLVDKINTNLDQLSDLIGFSYEGRRTIKVKYIRLCNMIDKLTC